MSCYMRFFIVPLISLFYMKTILSNEPDMAPFMNEMTPGLYVMFDNETKENKPTSVLDIMNTRKWYLSADMNHITHHGNMEEKSTACYSTSVTYRAAMWDLRRYFEIRALYTDSMEFEVGYLCHEIVYRYTLLLELYQMVERRFISYEHTNYASVSYMFYMYTNMLEQSKVIIHLCHMLHEVEKKYKTGKKGSGIFHDDIERTDAVEGPGKVDRSSIDENREAYERWLQKQRREEKKRAKERKKYWKQLQKFGLTTPRKKSPTKKGSWPIQYGWSIENW